MLFWVSAGAAALWLAVLALPWRPWSTREHLEAAPVPATEPLTDVTVLIPARNEARVIARTLGALGAQGAQLNVVLIDDQSDDGTAGAARAAGLAALHVVAGSAPPPGWSGKLWALEQGRAHAHTELVLLLDADVELDPGALAALRRKLREGGLDLASLMVALRMEHPWERLLLAPFVYFFKLLYPFHLANGPSPRFAAAAGGCILLRREALEAAGGFGALRDALIDDCTLARRIKAGGHRTWIGLTRSARSLRPCTGLADVWNMVARTAFTQLRYSSVLLLLCTAVMALAFAGPPAALILGDGQARLLGAAALGLMMAGYLPTLRFYDLPAPWAATLPVAGALFLAMTWTSALRYWRGERSRWKGRRYVR